MSGLHKQFKTNSEKENKGIKVEFPEAVNDDGTIPAFIVSRMGKANKRYTKALEAATRPYRRQIELNTMKNEIAEDLFLKVFADNILCGWENVQTETGEKMEYTKANAITLLTELPDVYERLQEEAKISSNFRDSIMEEEGKN